jgi:hypothetical protein
MYPWDVDGFCNGFEVFGPTARGDDVDEHG